MIVLFVIFLADIILTIGVCKIDYILTQKGVVSAALDYAKIILAVITLILLLAFAAIVIKNNGIIC